MRIHIHPMFRSISLSTPTVLTIAALLCIGIGTFGLSYAWHFDHRTADSLSAYCRIDFQSSHTESGALEGAVLTIWDSRYDNAKLKPDAILYTDGQAWEMKVSVKQTPPQGGHYKTENKLFVLLPRASLAAIQKAEEVRFRFYYDNGQTIDLPLNAPDLAYWKDQLQ